MIVYCLGTLRKCPDCSIKVNIKTAKCKCGEYIMMSHNNQFPASWFKFAASIFFIRIQKLLRVLHID